MRVVVAAKDARCSSAAGSIDSKALAAVVTFEVPELVFGAEVKRGADNEDEDEEVADEPEEEAEKS